MQFKAPRWLKAVNPMKPLVGILHVYLGLTFDSALPMFPSLI